MPTVTLPSPLSAIHSCDSVYFRFSGNSTTVSWVAWPTRCASLTPPLSVCLRNWRLACCRVFRRRGQHGLLSRAPEPRAVLLPESFAGPYPFGAAPGKPGAVSPTQGVMGPANLLQARAWSQPQFAAPAVIQRSLRWNDFGRVNASRPKRDSVQPRPESLTPVHASAGSR